MTTQSLTQQFAAEYARGVVAAMLKSIRTVRRANKLILLGALAVSTPHQQHFLASLGAGVFAWIIPLVFDLGMVSMLAVTQTVGMHTEAKQAAMKVLAVLVLVSAGVNFAAPGHPLLRVVFALTAALVAAVEWVTAKIRPDFAAIEARETETATAVRAEVKRCAADCTCRRHARNRTPAPAPEPVMVQAPIASVHALTARPARSRRSGPRLGKVAPGWITPEVRLAVANAN